MRHQIMLVTRDYSYFLEGVLSFDSEADNPREIVRQVAKSKNINWYSLQDDKENLKFGDKSENRKNFVEGLQQAGLKNIELVVFPYNVVAEGLDLDAEPCA